MKIRVLLLAIGCSIGAFGVYAQKGVDNGTQFGSGEDSVRCITNISYKKTDEDKESNLYTCIFTDKIGQSFTGNDTHASVHFLNNNQYNE
jgi:hypothetical protein